MSDDTGREDCLLCKIVDGSIDADVVHESATTVAFRVLDPQAPTHVLVIPKEHHRNIGALASGDPGLLGDLVAAARHVAEQEGLVGDDGEPGYRMVANTGRQAGQSVFHVHLHVLGGRDLGWPPG